MEEPGGFLTEDELYTLTGRKRASARIRVLRRQGIAFKLDGDGNPAVVWASVLAHSGRIPSQHRSEPNFDALNALIAKRKSASRS